MKNLIIVSLFLMAACKEEKKKEAVIRQESLPKEIVPAENKPNESEEAKEWLEKSIKNYFKEDLRSLDKEMQKITTKEYYEYKTDAMNVDMDVDGSLTLKEFQDKWKGKFDTDKAGINSGFLISGQDWINIEVRNCDLKSSSENSYVFHAVLADDGFKAKYSRQIKVIKSKDRFLIADVIEEE
ncbi:hypothetical protein [Chryseobacterium lathyri]|uniref:EF-hand domain-containing protein n=1 Tax=Chryseobacterium lathyri TaxID=395933 RepID=A0ABT9SRD4_9FLAO|nr:hypothetical protein [Chryseobacterium lathyri]MDP9961005.1 hypothetical protein [Chryseobacterium lathyri]